MVCNKGEIKVGWKVCRLDGPSGEATPPFCICFFIFSKYDSDHFKYEMLKLFTRLTPSLTSFCVKLFILCCYSSPPDILPRADIIPIPFNNLVIPQNQTDGYILGMFYATLIPAGLTPEWDFSSFYRPASTLNLGSVFISCPL